LGGVRCDEIVGWSSFHGYRCEDIVGCMSTKYTHEIKLSN